MNILVTGGAGYVGSILIPELIRNNHHVKCLDRFFFGQDFVTEDIKNNLEIIRDDIRWFEPNILNGVDVVMDLAAISNDPAGDLNPEKTFEINHLGRARVARLSKEQGVKRYILASSASIYGQQDEIADETAEVKPLTAYSKANNKAEIDNLPLNDENFCVTAMRFSSLYGFSSRMRFDTAVNCMALDLFNSRKISVRGKNNKRPFLHVKDAVKAYLLMLQANEEKIGGQIFNIGSEEQNYEMGELAKEVANSVNIESTIELSDTNDHRSYFASFKKIQKTVGFKPEYSVKDGVQEIFQKLENKELLETVKTKTVEWYKKLLSDNELRKEFLIDGKLL